MEDNSLGGVEGDLFYNEGGELLIKIRGRFLIGWEPEDFQVLWWNLTMKRRYFLFTNRNGDLCTQKRFTRREVYYVADCLNRYLDAAKDDWL